MGIGPSLSDPAQNRIAPRNSVGISSTAEVPHALPSRDDVVVMHFARFALGVR